MLKYFYLAAKVRCSQNTPNFEIENLAIFKGYRGINIQLGDPQRLEQAQQLFCTDDPTLCERNIIQLR